MKLKVIGAFVMVLGIAGAAAAYQPQGGPAPRGDFRRGPELSREDRAHFEAMRKVRAELRDELRKEKPDKQRARTLFAKEISSARARFSRRSSTFVRSSARRASATASRTTTTARGAADGSPATTGAWATATARG